jgi:hypothetical protein
MQTQFNINQTTRDEKTTDLKRYTSIMKEYQVQNFVFYKKAT